MSDELDMEMALALLAEDAAKTRGGSGVDSTEPRIAAVWYKLVTELSKTCENPECSDPRPQEDKGRLVTVLIKGQHMCRYCFLGGWLSNATDS